MRRSALCVVAVTGPDTGAREGSRREFEAVSDRTHRIDAFLCSSNIDPDLDEAGWLRVDGR